MTDKGARLRLIAADLKGGARISFLLRGIAVGTGFALHVSLTNLMSVRDYGSYTYGVTWVTVLVLFASLGLNPGVIRFIPAYLERREWGLLKGILRRSQQLCVAMGIVLALVWGGAMWAAGAVEGAGGNIIVLLAMALLPVRSVLNNLFGIFRGFTRIFASQAPSALIEPLGVVVTVWCFALAGFGIGSDLGLSIKLAINLLLMAVLSVAVFRCAPRAGRQTRPTYETRAWLAVSFPLLFVSGSYLLLGQVDILMVGSMLGVEQAAIYSIAVRMASLVGFSIGAVNTIAAPMISRMYANGDSESMQHFVHVAAQWIFFTTLPIALGLVLLGGFLLGLFGEAYVAGYWVLMLLIGGYVFGALMGHRESLLAMTGHQLIHARIMTASVALNFVLNLIAIPIWGIEGAAVTSVVTMLIWNVATMVTVKRNLGISSTIFAALLR